MSKPKEHSQEDRRRTVRDTLDMINQAVIADPNALTTTRGGDVAPEAAYIEMIREVLALA